MIARFHPLVGRGRFVERESRVDNRQYNRYDRRSDRYDRANARYGY